jgi:hypothetical protein
MWRRQGGPTTKPNLFEKVNHGRPRRAKTSVWAQETRPTWSASHRHLLSPTRCPEPAAEAEEEQPCTCTRHVASKRASEPPTKRSESQCVSSTGRDQGCEVQRGTEEENRGKSGTQRRGSIISVQPLRCSDQGILYQITSFRGSVNFKAADIRPIGQPCQGHLPSEVKKPEMAVTTFTRDTPWLHLNHRLLPRSETRRPHRE